MKQKLVLAWVDLSGFALTGRYLDRLCQRPETRVVPEAKAACWGDNTPELLARLKAHVDQEKADHAWMGYFLLDYKDDILAVARAKALAVYAA